MFERRMIGLALAALILSFAATAHSDETGHPFLVVSDIDDTIKITNVLSKTAAVGNGLFGQRTFTGMSELYQELVKNARTAAGPTVFLNPPIVYMSGSPPFLKGSLRKMLVKGHNFPNGRFMLRDWIKTKDVYTFKTAGFKSLAIEVSMPFVALGDDTERDADVLTEFAAAHPDHTAAIYIHRVTGKDIAPGSIEYYTAFDVALSEFEAGRLNAEQVERVGNTILDSKDPTYLFPDFAKCPEDLTYADTPKVSQNPVLMQLKYEIADYILRYCFERNNGFKIFDPAKAPVLTPKTAAIVNRHSKRADARLLNDIESLAY